jgi:hypothetical protein
MKGKRVMLSTQRRLLLLAILLLLVVAAWAQESTRRGKFNASVTPNATSNPVVGGGSAGQITKWTGVDGSNTYTVGDSNIFEDKYGKIGIGTTAPTSLLTVKGMIETTLGGYKFPDGTVQTTAGIPFVIHDSSLMGDGRSATPLGIALGGVQTIHLANSAVTAPKIANGTVVRSLNNLFDNVSLIAGSNITITPTGNNLTIAAPNSLTSVAHDSTLTGNGTTDSPLGVANGGIGNAQLANNAVTSSKVANGTIGNAQLADNAVTFAKIASGQVVTKFGNLTDNVTLAAGSNITITPSGNTVSIAGVAGSSVAYHALGADSAALNSPGIDVVSKQVPAGSYIIFFKTFLSDQDTDDQDVGCSLSTGDGGTLKLVEHGDPGERAVLVLQDGATFSATTTIIAHCTGFKVFAIRPTLTAIKVGSIQ